MISTYSFPVINAITNYLPFIYREERFPLSQFDNKLQSKKCAKLCMKTADFWERAKSSDNIWSKARD